MKFKTTLLAAASMMVIAPAAQAYEGLYGAIGAGLNYMGDQDLTNDHISGGGAYAMDSDADYDNGIGVYAALGKKWASNWRTELEFSYRDNSIGSIAADGAGFTGWPAGTISGSTTTTALLANFLYDFDSGGSFTPYLGAGVGIANVDHDIIGSDAAGLPAPHTIAYGPGKWGVAYQGIAGVAIGLTEGLAASTMARLAAFPPSSKPTTSRTASSLACAGTLAQRLRRSPNTKIAGMARAFLWRLPARRSRLKTPLPISIRSSSRFTSITTSRT